MKNANKQTATAPAKLSMAEFTTNAIVKLRSPEKSLGIHTVYSGFNGAFRQYFGLEKDAAIAAINELVAKGVVASRYVRGGVMLYLPQDAPTKNTDDKSNKALAAILN